MENLVTVRLHAPRSFHPQRIADLVEKLLAAGRYEAERTASDTDIVDHDAEDALQLKVVIARTLFLRPKIALREALEMYYESRKWVEAGLDARIFDDFEKSFGLRNVADTPTKLPVPRLVDAGFTGQDVQQQLKLADEDVDAFVLQHESTIRAAMVAAGIEAIRQIGQAENIERR